MASILIEVPVDPRECRHETLEELGRQGDASFHRCETCGSIVIARHGHRWLIRPSDESGPLPF